MTIGAEDEDYWTDLPEPSVQNGDAASAPALNVHTVEEVEHFSAQLGVAEPLSVPSALREALFGQADVIDGRAILPLRTYAVLDAGKVPGLPEMLDDSRLDHACLFQGAAGEELRDVAPYLVRVEEEDRFTRRLFTKGDAPWDMWDKEPGIFLRSQASLNELREHLRQFTKVQDETGSWLYFRFWEPCIFAGYVDEAGPAYLAGLFSSRSAIISSSLYFASGRWRIASMDPSEVTPRAAVDVGAVARIATNLVADRELASLRNRQALTQTSVPPDHWAKLARSIVATMHRLGFRSRYHLRYFIAWSITYGSELDGITQEVNAVLHDRTKSTEIRFQIISELIRNRLGRRLGALFG